MDAYAQYKTQAVSTAGPGQLVSMLYHGAVTAVDVAAAALTDDGAGVNYEVAHREIVRAQDIVTELTVSLDHEQGGQIATNLAQLYRYCTEQLVDANVSKDPAPLQVVRDTLAGLADAWDQMLSQQPAAAG